jgi:hypothetical protein
MTTVGAGHGTHCSTMWEPRPRDRRSAAAAPGGAAQRHVHSSSSSAGSRAAMAAAVVRHWHSPPAHSAQSADCQTAGMAGTHASE